MPGRPLPQYLAVYLQHRQAVEYVLCIASAIILCALSHFF